jgi:hypothetical protein
VVLDIVVIDRGMVKHLHLAVPDLFKLEFTPEVLFDRVAFLKSVWVDELEVCVRNPPEFLDKLCGNFIFGIKYTFWNLYDHSLVHWAPYLVHVLAVVAVEVHQKIGREEVVVLTKLRKVSLVIDKPAGENPFDFTCLLEIGLVLSLKQEDLCGLELLKHQLSVITEEYSLVVGVCEVRMDELEVDSKSFWIRDLNQLQLHEFDRLSLKGAFAAIHSGFKSIAEELFIVKFLTIRHLLPQENVVLVPVSVEDCFLTIEWIASVAVKVNFVIEGEAALDFGGN